MSAVPRRSIDEIKALHRLEPSLRDMYVEGIEDKRFMEWFLDRLGGMTICVYSIETVDVPQDCVQALDLPEGNRGRVVALAAALDGDVPVDQVVCVADRDLSWLVDACPDLSLMLYTDYSCMEMYFWDSATIDQCLLAVGLRDKVAVDTLMQFVESTLVEVALVRGVGRMQGCWREVPTVAKCCKYKSGQYAFDADSYRGKFLSGLPRKDFDACLADARRMVPGDARLCMNGHDMTELLAWVFRELRVDQRVASEPSVRALLVAALEHGRLCEVPLFAGVVGRLGS